MMASLVSLLQENFKNSEKSMEVVNTDGENLYIFWTIWEISMKFSRKMCLMIILKFRQKKEQVFTLSLEDKFLEKLQGGGSEIEPLCSLFKGQIWR